LRLETIVLRCKGGDEMTTDTVRIEDRFARLRGRETRTRSVATRFTPAEEKALLKAAEVSGKNLREWAREVLLGSTNLANQHEMPMHIFTELVAIQMLLMNTLEPLLRGDRMQTEQIKLLYRQVQTAKAVKGRNFLRCAPKGEPKKSRNQRDDIPRITAA
jgi:hypothetical protein